MAFIATVPDADGHERTLGVARAMTDPDNVSAEFGIIVRPEMQGSGLGRVLMDKLIRYQRALGTQRLTASVLAENDRMRQLAQKLGFADQPASGSATMHELTLPLQPPAEPQRRRRGFHFRKG
jgi:acetyltransferase